NEKKLRWLERRFELPDRTVIIISSVTPVYIMTTPAPPASVVAGVLWYFARCHSLLDRFVCITAEELELRHDEWQRRQRFRTISQLSASEPRSWLEKETAYNSFLRQLAKEMVAEAQSRRGGGRFDAAAEREHQLDVIGTR